MPKEKKDGNIKDIIKSALAASGFQTKKPKTEFEILQDKLKAMEKKFKAVAASNKSGGGTNQGRGYCKPERKPTVRWKFYCSSCGTNKTHPSSKYKDKQLWHKDETTYDNHMGGCHKNNHLWHDTTVP